ncbi:uncharacterized protein LOC110848809 [Folsomia candida]|uniref:uncharacterized protein LOC110848809 n=1 Tax=Folsomia candida TaxID=158441 RepID=UPI001604F1DC|nr:uncharacterized protein LOC110848809 [Folsomia candida]
MNLIPSLILDTRHFLLLLNNLTLPKNRNLVLLTYDIESMYTNLDVNLCKKHCLNKYLKFKGTSSVPYKFSSYQFQKLMSLCLDYNFNKFKNLYFKQTKGIAMGNAASVSVANITAECELSPLFDNCEYIFFHARFVDDGFMIIDSTDIIYFNVWCMNIFSHSNLKFTLNHSTTDICFLDVNVSLSNNKLSTTLYKKPMSRPLYAHYLSNLPKQLLNSLPYSQGLRIIKICSEIEDRETEIEIMLNTFHNRCYPNDCIDNTRQRLAQISRLDLLTKCKNLIIDNLKLHHPEILCNMKVKTETHDSILHRSYVVMPYYKSLPTLNSLTIEFIMKESDRIYTHMLHTLNVKVSYRKINSLTRQLCNNI